MIKDIKTSKDIRDKIMSGLDAISNPVKQTLGPKGKNVLFEDELGNFRLTNDGVTIAKQIEIEDSFENSIVEIIKDASLRTNAQAGDGTSTTIILSQILVKEVIKLLDEGRTWVEIKELLEEMGQTLINGLSKRKKDLKTDKDYFNIARISANNDEHIAENVVEVIKTAGENGMVFIEETNKSKTQLIKDLGFMLEVGIPMQELLKDKGKFTLDYPKCGVLVTDKHIYYDHEAEAILKASINAGLKSILIVAKKVSGDALNVLVHNHQKDVLNVLFVEESDPLKIDDLAVYLNTKVITEKTGNLVENLTPEDLVMANRVYADPKKTLIIPSVSASKQLKSRIQELKKEVEEKEEEKTKKRLASLTNGVVTIKVGGNTLIEVKEKIYRYEDSINAVRSAMKEGYLIGGGIALLRAFKPKEHPEIIRQLVRKYTESIIRQIADNCGEHSDSVVNHTLTLDYDWGYNAKNGKFQKMNEIIDPFLVIKLAILNSISVANIISSTGYYITNVKENKDGENSRTIKGRKN